MSRRLQAQRLESLSLEDSKNQMNLSQVPVSIVERSTGERKKVHIPVIDLGDLDHGGPEARDRIVQEIKAAARELGYFFVVNHGIDRECLAQKRSVSERFFSLPADEKKKAQLHAPGLLRNSGYGIQSPPPDAKAPIVVRRETFITKGTLKETSPSVNWPTNPPEFREVYQTFEKHVFELGQRLLNLLAGGLDLPASYIAELFSEEPRVQLMASWYHPLELPPAGLRTGVDLSSQGDAGCQKTLGMSGHTDIGMLVLLLQNEVDGVECWTEGQWVRCAFPEEDHPGGALLILLGEWMEVLSNGFYHCPVHRVVVHQTKFRFSTIASIDVHANSVMGPAPHLIKDDNPAIYKTVPTMERLHFVLGANPQKDSTRLSKSYLKIDPTIVDPSRDFVVSDGQLLLGGKVVVN